MDFSEETSFPLAWRLPGSPSFIKRMTLSTFATIALFHFSVSPIKSSPQLYQQDFSQYFNIPFIHHNKPSYLEGTYRTTLCSWIPSFTTATTIEFLQLFFY